MLDPGILFFCAVVGVVAQVLQLTGETQDMAGRKSAGGGSAGSSFLSSFVIGASNLLNSSYVVSSGSLTGPFSGSDMAVDAGSLGLNSVFNIPIV